MTNRVWRLSLRSSSSAPTQASIWTFDHPINLLRMERLTALLDVAGFGKLCADLSERDASSGALGQFINVFGQAYCVWNNIDVLLSPLWSCFQPEALIRSSNACCREQLFKCR